MTRNMRFAGILCVTCLLSMVLPYSLCFAGGEGGVEVAADSDASYRDQVASRMHKAALAPSSDSPYCGVYAIARAIEIQDADFDFAGAIDPRFIGSQDGSSASELESLAAANGFDAYLRSNLGKLDLLALNAPVVAHMRDENAPTKYSHWVCALGMADGVHVFDGHESERVISFTRFMANWDGLGIVIAPRNQVMPRTLWSLMWFRVSAICILAYTMVRLCANIPSLWPRTVPLQMAAIVVVGIVAAFGGNVVLASIGEFPRGALMAQSAHWKGEEKSASLDDAIAAGQDAHAVVVDATSRGTYAHAHLPNAVNVPVSTPFYQIEDAFREIPSNTRIVVYCWSDKCQYDSQVAQKLLRLGFQDVAICDSGTQEYLSSLRKDEAP